MRKKSEKWYVDTLKNMVEQRKGKVDAFLVPQLQTTAQCWRMLDKVYDELDKTPLTMMEMGSQGQTKMVMNPLLALYDKLSRTLKLHYSALGLNYDATPSKVSETDVASEKNDPLAELMRGVAGTSV